MRFMPIMPRRTFFDRFLVKKLPFLYSVLYTKFPELFHCILLNVNKKKSPAQHLNVSLYAVENIEVEAEISEN